MSESDENNNEILFRRILVAVDTSAHSRAALKAAVTLAKITKADIHGLFVREEHWSRISRLPSATAINELTGETSSLEEESLEKEIKRLQRRLRRQLKYFSLQHEINHSWKTAQGKVAEEILAAAQEADLITIGRRGRSLMRQRKLGSTAKAIIQQAEKPVLILKKGLSLDKNITAVYDTSEKSQHALKLAMALAERNEGRLSILVVSDDQQTSSQRDKTIEKLVEQSPVPVKITTLRRPDIGQFINVINHEHSGLLVIAKNQQFLQTAILETTLKYLNCPILMIN